MAFSIEKMTEVVKNLPYDLRAEVVLADLVEQGIDPDMILIRSNGLFKRNFGRDIERVSMLDANRRQKQALVEVNREGIYDSLPEAVTHVAKRSKKAGFKTAAEMAAEVKDRRYEEKAARNFFAPFENEFYRKVVELEIIERNILKGFLGTSRYTALMNKFWQLPQVLNARQKSVFIYLMPIIYKAVGNLKLTKLCYSAILEVDVDIIYRNSVQKIEVEIREPGTGEPMLGVNFVCGHNLYINKPFFEIAIGPLTDGQLDDYLPMGKGRDIIDFLNGYYLPFDADSSTIIAQDAEHKDFELGSPKSRFGFTSYLPLTENMTN